MRIDAIGEADGASSRAPGCAPSDRSLRREPLGRPAARRPSEAAPCCNCRSVHSMKEARGVVAG